MNVGQECMGRCAGFARSTCIVPSNLQVMIKDSAQIAMVGRSQGAKLGKLYSGVCCNLTELHARVLAGGSLQWVTYVSHRLHLATLSRRCTQ